MRELTTKQAAFVREYAKDWNATAAAERAGLSGDYGRQLLTKSHVQAAIEQLREDARSEAVMSLRELQEWWSNLVRGETVRLMVGNPADGLSVETIPDLKERIKASELLGKSQGGFTDKHEHMIKRDPRSMTDEELEAALADAGLTD